MTTATQPGIEPGTSRFRAIALPVKLLGQVPLRPKHGATLSLSSRKNANDPRFHAESTDVPGRPNQWNPLKLEKVGVCGENILENTLGECRINILKIERRKRGTTGEKKK